MMRVLRMLGRRGRGATVILAALLVTSAAMRAGLGAGEAFAQAGKPVAPQPLAPASVDTAALDQPAARDLSSRAEAGKLLEALTAREKQVTEREKQLEVRRRALEVADREVRARLADLEEMERQLRQTLTLADGAAEDDLARLTTVYESMKAKNAATLFETMDAAFAAGFLARMRPDAAANILAGLSPEAAYRVSVIMAGRNANAPTD